MIATLPSHDIITVASPPDKGAVTSPREEPQQQPVVNRNGQLSKQGSLTILRRSSSRTLSRTRVAGDPELSESDEAAEKAAVRSSDCSDQAIKINLDSPASHSSDDSGTSPGDSTSRSISFISVVHTHVNLRCNSCGNSDFRNRLEVTTSAKLIKSFHQV
ncbi:hypothetical protein FHG87_011617 [Trinorchestia longiramus]|nr:hypothetical protein FHG87_011617 [Trinorchestia longiramus]